MRIVVCCLWGLFAGCLAADPSGPKEDELLVKTSIADSDECRDDFLALKDTCGVDPKKSDKTAMWMQNVVVLDCLQNPPENTQISEACDHFLWKLKKEVTVVGFLPNLKESCEQDIDYLRKCYTAKDPALFLPCLVEQKHNTKSIQCRKFLTFMETLIFTDYRLISKFLSACDSSVIELGCGRTAGARRLEDSHSQGKTIACLEDKIEQVDEQCQHEILQIAQIQGESVDFDRALVGACKDDIHRFCQVILDSPNPSPGAVYDCLMHHKMEPDMTLGCREQVSRRQRLIGMDYRVSGGLVAACTSDIKQHQCAKGEKKDGAALSRILICLEDARLGGATISGECTHEMDEYRHNLMSDYSITPELHRDCLTDIRTHCPNTGKNGKTIHCLMEVSMHKDPAIALSPKCQDTFDEFIREVQSDDDWTADPVLEDACVDVVAAACDPKAGKDGVMSCLMENMARDSNAMTGECRSVLMQIQYFFSREVLVDHDLYKQCRGDAKKLCEAEDGWHRKESDPVNKLVLPCLVRNLYNEDDDLDHEDEEEKNEQPSGTVSPGCSDEIERVLRQRAISVRLFPAVEQPCRDFLHSQCTTHIGPGEEMTCLQENLEILPLECRKSVVKFTEYMAQNPYLHPNIIKGCQVEIHENCGMEDKNEDSNGVLECLSRLYIDRPPGSPDAINPRCATVVRTWQLLTLKDFHFSYNFQHNCKADIRTHCKGKTAKYEIVHCLAAVNVHDVVNDQPHRLHTKCRQELKYELLQQHSSLELNPLLANACKIDLSKLCPGIQGLEAEECLRQQKHKKLSPVCRRVLLTEEKEEAIDNEIDVPLVRNCKKEIKQHCPNANSSSIVDCLAEFAEDLEFDEKCLHILKKRLIEHSKDVRLNSDLSRACRPDIKKYCINELKLQTTEEFYEGKIIFCLKEKYSKNVNLLTKKCSKQMQKFIRHSYIGAASPIIEEKCPNSVRKCAEGPNSLTESKHLIMIKEFVVNQECLYQLWTHDNLLDGKECLETLAIVAESQNRDVKADRVLYEACQIDLSKFCRDVISGEGKRFACLVSVSKDKNMRLEPACATIVENRVAMYRIAIQAHPVAQALELYSAVMESPDRHVFLTVFATMVIIIFVLGLCFGRVTKRVKAELKDR